jgi:hypothetical protein
MERLHEFEEERCEGFVRREPLAEVAYESREALCMGFVRREPLAAALCRFIGDRRKRFSCRKRLAEMLHGFEKALCESFSSREPLAAALRPFEDELGELEADSGSFEELLHEGPAGRNPRAERLREGREAHPIARCGGRIRGCREWAPQRPTFATRVLPRRSLFAYPRLRARPDRKAGVASSGSDSRQPHISADDLVYQLGYVRRASSGAFSCLSRAR